jgi:LysM repeat protein
MEKRPSIVGYTVKEEDDLWTLAKRYSTTMESIREMNEMANEPPKPGDRILIFKENLSIL